MNRPAYKRPESVLVLLHDGQGRALMLERVSPPGFWQSVTGSLEEGETPFATALREVAEETSILLAPEELKDWHTRNEYEIYEHWRHRYPQHRTRLLRPHPRRQPRSPLRTRTPRLPLAAAGRSRQSCLFPFQPRSIVASGRRNRGQAT